MATISIRIYSGEIEGTTLLGFTKGALDVPDHQLFTSFLRRKGYKWRDIERVPEGSYSYRHIEVHPPMKDEHIEQLGVLCVGGRIENREVEGIVLAFNNEVRVLDNRAVLPDHEGVGTVIAQC